MGLKPTFTQADVAKRFDKFLDIVERRQIERMKMLGEMCVIHARELPPEIGFHDQTGNLRSSIGYIIFKDGVSVHESFEQVKSGSEGAKTGRNLANKIGEKFRGKGIVLVVVAGMNYALALEANGAYKLKSKRPYVVLTTAEQLAKQELPRMLEDLKSNIYKAFD
jgi:hypothetical protein